RPAHESDEVEIAKGVEISDPFAVEPPPRLRLSRKPMPLPQKLLFDPWVEREDDRDMTGQGMDGIEKVRQAHSTIDVRRTVERDDGVRAVGIQPQTVENRRILPARPKGVQSVDHDVTDEVDLLRGDPFSEEVLPPALFGHKQDVGDSVCEQTVDLFRHRAVEASESGFHVSDWDP